MLPKAPDSLRAELELTAFAGGRKSTVSAAFSAKPRGGYKLDLYGLPGMVAASFLWTREQWTLVLFDREEFSQGAGEHVEMGNLGLREVSVHDIFSFLWGDFAPGDAPRDAGGDPDSLKAELPQDWRALGGGTFGYTGDGVRWRMRLDQQTGLAREAWREDSAFRIEFTDYRTVGSGAVGSGDGAHGSNRPLPGKVRLYRYRDPVLEIKVKSVEDNPHWRRNPFFIKVPKGFTGLRPARDADDAAPPVQPH